jgi:CBS domain-containing protein
MRYASAPNKGESVAAEIALDDVGPMLIDYSKSGKEISVRELLEYWGYKGRGQHVVATIHRNLRAIGLASEPSFEYGGLSSRIKFVPISESPDDVENDSGPVSDPVTEVNLPSELHVGRIPSSRSEVTTAAEGDSIVLAQTVMIQFNFSQLPVLSQAGQVVGLVSWDTIARKGLVGGAAVVADAMDRSPLILRLTDDLLKSMPQIVQAGCAIIRDESGGIAGIVTTADLSEQFKRLAEPFLLVGRCERELRRVLDSRFSAEELAKAQKYKSTVVGAGALTIGNIQHFLTKPDNWSKLGWQMDQKQFISWIETVRDLRNEVAHFNQDEETSETALDQVRSLTAWLEAA